VRCRSRLFYDFRMSAEHDPNAKLRPEASAALVCVIA